MFSLSEFPRGMKVKLQSINLEPAIKMRLAEIGLNPDSHVLILNNPKKGPLVILYRGTKIMIDRFLSENIVVLPIGE